MKWNAIGIEGAMVGQIVKPIYLTSILIECEEGADVKENNQTVLERGLLPSSRFKKDACSPEPTIIIMPQEFAFSRWLKEKSKPM